MKQYVCKICGKVFDYRTTRGTKVCSNDCFKKILSEMRMGEGNPRFNNGWRQYRRIKKDVTLCENCGRKYRLDVHHKDGNHSNNDESNLIKVCRRCHMLLDGRLNEFNKTRWNLENVKPISEETRNKMSIARSEYWKRKNGGG